MARARRKSQRRETGVKGARILVVEARYYDDIADMLLRGAKRVVKDAQAMCDIVTVPGALEMLAEYADVDIAFATLIDHDRLVEVWEWSAPGTRMA